MHRLTIVRVSAAYTEHNWSKEELAGSRGNKKKGAGFLWRAGDKGRAVASGWRSRCRTVDGEIGWWGSFRLRVSLPGQATAQHPRLAPRV